MVFKLTDTANTANTKFENDVKMYGIQTLALGGKEIKPFENDVKMYGIQTRL